MNQNVATNATPSFPKIILSGTSIVGANLQLPNDASPSNPHISTRSELGAPSLYLGDRDDGEIIAFIDQDGSSVATIDQNGEYNGTIDGGTW